MFFTIVDTTKADNQRRRPTSIGIVGFDWFRRSINMDWIGNLYRRRRSTNNDREEGDSAGFDDREERDLAAKCAAAQPANLQGV